MLLFTWMNIALVYPRFADAQSTTTPTVTLETRAQDFYQQGRELFFAGTFEDARVAFQSSLDVVDSPNTRMYLGRALLGLGRVSEAWATLDRAARDAEDRARTEPRYTPTHDAARAEADALLPRLAWLTVDITTPPEGVVVTINGLPLQRALFNTPLPHDPGPVALMVAAPGHRTQQQEMVLAVGARQTVNVSLEILPPVPVAPVVVAPVHGASVLVTPVATPTQSSLPLRIAGITALSVGGAAVIAGGVFGLIAWGRYNEVEGNLSPGVELSRSEYNQINARILEGEQNRDMANVLMISGGVVAVTGAVLLGLGLRTPTRRTPTVSVMTVSTGAGLSLEGSF
jgi:Flp pilus assembly protein TadG